MNAYGYVGLVFGLLGILWALGWFLTKTGKRLRIVTVRRDGKETVTVTQTTGYGPCAVTETQVTVKYYANDSDASAENPPQLRFNPIMAKMPEMAKMAPYNAGPVLPLPSTGPEHYRE